ncbi:MAG: hypothetical protein J6W03_09080 [Bacteroidaceae bacterium]|nr:hypothetical protein [Bacteroidaceae bacterium]
MKQKLYSLFLTALLSMAGMQVWAQGLTTTVIDGVTYYEIGNADQLLAFAQLVNGDPDNEIPGQGDANALLTADINMAEVLWEAAIGTAESPFTGIFDGQGHNISAFETTSVGRGGLIGTASDATIKNFSIDGSLEVTAGEGSGAIGYAIGTEPEKGCRITNVHSSLDITVTEAGCSHVGGVVGSAQYNNDIRGCTFSGTMSVVEGNYNCFGGVVGYMASDSILYCANYGEISFKTTNAYCGGIAGYMNNVEGTVKGCLNMGTITFTGEGAADYGGAIIGRMRNNTPSQIFNNCWLEGSAKTGTGENSVPTTRSFTLDELPSGEICYYLNGDQKEIGWYQTLPADQQPTLDATHAQVYLNGRRHCNGELYDDISYSNENLGIVQDEHDMVDGVCSYCGYYDEDVIAASMVLNADGYYEISNPAQLKWFSKHVNAGNFDANAILTADIDMSKTISSTNPWVPIGNWSSTTNGSACFKGHFDGQGHTINNFNATSTQNYYGIFGVVSEGCLIENFNIYGTMTLGHKTGGVVGYTRDTSCNIRNIRSYMTLNVTYTDNPRPGGIVGSAVNGTTNIENCIYSGILNVIQGDIAGGNIGGIVGYVNNNSAAIVNITNCLFDGEIHNVGTKDETAATGGIIGYNNSGKATIKNCLSIGTVEGYDGRNGMFIGLLNGSNTTFTNVYYAGDFVNGTESAKEAKGDEPVEVTADELASGEICWELNEETLLDAAWRQTLEVEPYPLPKSEGDYVYYFTAGYENINSDNISTLISDLSAEETEFIEDEDLIAYQALIDAYKAEIESWENYTDIDEFLEAYQAAAEIKEDILKSVAKYEAYVQACEAAAAEIEENNLSGETTDILLTYLEDNTIEAGDETYPNGSYGYIMDTRNLDNDALDAEIAFVNQMLEAAVAADGIFAGNDVSRLFTNTSFADAFNGWTVESEESVTMSSGGTTDVMPIVRGGGNGAFNVYQTASNLPNGIYMTTTNAMYRASSDAYLNFYAGQVYMNDIVNYVMTPGEDVIPEDEAEDGINCLISADYQYDDGIIFGYTPNNMNGSSYAFNAGRYKNFCATEVTDGTLTIGVRNPGNGLASQWMPFSNIHVYYLGTAEEADERLTEVLAGYAQRAQTIVEFESDYEEYATYPNMYEGLRTQLEETIEKATAIIDDDGAEEVEESKLELISIFSALFNEVYACRMAYIEMCNTANGLYDFLDALDAAGLITDADYNLWDGKIQDALAYSETGEITTEEAIAITQELKECEFALQVVDGVYQLASARDMLLFGTLVNTGQTSLNAVMTNDIDMSELEYFDPIGNSSTPYTGTFDGQGYSIKNFVYVAAGDNNGLFGCINGSARVKNFRISGSLTSDGYTYNGVIGQAEGNSVISGIYSDMSINVSNRNAHSGGIVGGMTTGSTMEIRNCEYAGTLTHTGQGDCQAGICGYTYGGGIFNCVFSGTIIGQSSKYGGILGYCKVPGFKGVQNCLCVGKIIANEGCTTAAAIIANWNGANTTAVKNNYYRFQPGSTTTIAIGNKTSSCEAPTEVTEKQLMSGEVCYKLNGSQSVINWYQNINEDSYPVPFENHEKVFYNETEDFYYNLINDVVVGIGSVKSEESKVETVMTGIYNLAGQRLEKLQKGINIVNGKKVLVK